MTAVNQIRGGFVGDGRIAYTPLPNYEETVEGATTTTRVTYSLAGQATAVRVSGDPDPANNGLFTLYSDHLGSAGAIQKSDGSSTIVTQYTPFGGYRAGSGPNEITDRAYTGQRESMADLGLYYYGARFYAPGLGRFLSADTIVPKSEDPQSLNRYAYTRNNPLKYVDSDGHCWGFASGIRNWNFTIGGTTYGGGVNCANIDMALAIVQHHRTRISIHGRYMESNVSVNVTGRYKC